MTSARDSETRISIWKAGRKAIFAAASLALAAFWLASPAEARVPAFSAACPGRVDVQADNGGRVFINGQPARVRPFNNRSYEARLGRVVVSVIVGRGGRLDVSSRMRGGGSAMCQVRPPRMEPMRDGPGRMPPMRDGFGGRPGDRGPMAEMAAVCRDQAAARFRVRPSEIVTNLPFRDGRRFVVPGSFRHRGHPAAFACAFDANGRLLSVR